MRNIALPRDCEILTDSGWASPICATNIRTTTYSGNIDTEKLCIVDTKILISTFRCNRHYYSVLGINDINYLSYRFMKETRRSLNTIPSHFWVKSTYPTSMLGVSLTDDEIRLLVNIVTDGHFDSGIYLRFHFKKQRKIDNITNLLDRLDIKYTLSSLSTNGTRKIYVGRICEKLTEWIPNKEWHRKIINLSPSQFKVFISEYEITDGCKYKNSSQISTISDNTTNIIQELCVLNGYRSSAYLKDKDNTTCINIIKEDLAYLSRSNLKKEDPSDFIVIKISGDVVHIRLSGKTYSIT